MLMTKVKSLIIVCNCMVFLSACATQRPVLYPNYTLQEAGSEAAHADIDECMRLASVYAANPGRGNEIARDTAENTVVGGASGAAAGAVFGNVGKGAAAGAAGAGAATVTRGLFRSNKPDPAFRSFVERCLRDKGYEPIGWQ